MRCVSVAAFAALGLMAVAGPSHADTEQEERAKAHKTLGKAAFRSGDYEGCARQYLASHKLAPDPGKLFNVGLCYEKGDKIAESLKAFQDYLAAAPKGPRAGEATTRVELLELKLKTAGTGKPAGPAAPAPTVEETPLEEAPLEHSSPAVEPTTSAPTRVAEVSSTQTELSTSAAESDSVSAHEVARGNGISLGAGLGFASDRFSAGASLSLAGGYDLSSNSEPHSMGNRIGLRVDLAALFQDGVMGSLTHVGAEYRPSLQFGRVRAYAGVGLGFNRYGVSGDDIDDDVVETGVGFQGNVGVDVFAFGRYAIGGYGQTHLASFDGEVRFGLYAFGLALTRY